MVARRAHNPKVARSSRVPATKKRLPGFGNLFLFPKLSKTKCSSGSLSARGGRTFESSESFRDRYKEKGCQDLVTFFCFRNLLFMFVTYVLHSDISDKIYIGYTADLINRFHSHNELATKGFTIKFRPWKVVYVEFHESKEEAMKREKELKSSRGRNFIRTEVLL